MYLQRFCSEGGFHVRCAKELFLIVPFHLLKSLVFRPQKFHFDENILLRIHYTGKIVFPILSLYNRKETDWNKHNLNFCFPSLVSRLSLVKLLIREWILNCKNFKQPSTSFHSVKSWQKTQMILLKKFKFAHLMLLLHFFKMVQLPNEFLYVKQTFI